MEGPKRDEVNFQFEDSRLGTKEYWDHFYTNELANFEDTGDEGEVWFGHSAEMRMLKFVTERVPLSARICDLGCGNGSLLRKMRDHGFSNLTGLDYSARAIELANRVCSPSRILDNPQQGNSFMKTSDGIFHIDFRVADLTASKLDTELCGQFDILLDKGTFDAISLGSERHRLISNYLTNVCQMFRHLDEDNDRSLDNLFDSDDSLKRHSPNASALSRRRHQRLLIIVSCNFTKEDLLDLLECELLHFDSELPNGSSIKFGGKTGTTSTGVVFRWGDNKV